MRCPQDVWRSIGLAAGKCGIQDILYSVDFNIRDSESECTNKVLKIKNWSFGIQNLAFEVGFEMDIASEYILD